MTNLFTGGKRIFVFIALLINIASPAWADGVGLCTRLFESDPGSDPSVARLLEVIIGENLRVTSDYVSHHNYKFSSSHIEILRVLFGVVFGKNAYVPPAEKMFDRYENYMKMLVRTKTITERDILRPGKVYKTLLGTVEFSPYLEPLPAGAKLLNEAPMEVYKSMITEGLFPMGGPKLFEHDLAHLTSFIANPQYMVRLRRSIVGASPFVYKSRSAREFFINEVLVVARPAQKESLINTLLLSKKMRRNLKELSLAQMREHVASLSIGEINSAVEKLVENYDLYFNSMGGATRDPYNSYSNNYFGPGHLAPIRSMINKVAEAETVAEKIEGFAKLQVVLVKISDVKMDDWFDALETPYINPQSSLGRLFSDRRLWEGYKIYDIFTTANYSLPH